MASSEALFIEVNVKSKTYKDGYLKELWRKAVKAEYGERCVKCGAMPVECHHIVRRAKSMLSNDWRNGIPLCHEHHRWAHTLEGRLWVYDKIGEERLDYLTERDCDMKTYLVQHGMTRADFGKWTAKELKEKIKSVDE